MMLMNIMERCLIPVAKVDIHLVSWNRPKMTELVIKTIHRNTKPGTYRLVVLDNASEQSTVDMLQGLFNDGLIDEFIPLKTNLGLEAARNFLLKNATEGKYFVCVDNDCLPPPKDETDWLEKLIALMETDEDYAAISMRTDPMIGTGNIFEEADKNGEELVDFDHPGGSFRLMRTTVASRIGGWDRSSTGRGQEEKYICGKLHEAGYKTAFATNIKCLHLYGPLETTDRWGYPKEWQPEDTGHSDVWHPKFGQGDDFDEIEKYSGKELTDAYRDN